MSSLSEPAREILTTVAEELHAISVAPNIDKEVALRVIAERTAEAIETLCGASS